MWDWLTSNVGSIAGLAGGLFAADKAADTASSAQNTSLEAARLAADAAAFKPYGVTTGFGTSYFNPENQTAGYRLDPALQAYRDKLLQMGAGALPSNVGQSGQQIGSSYLSQLQNTGGMSADMAKRYQSLANRTPMPTNIGNAYANVRDPSYQNLSGMYNNLRGPSYQNVGNAFSGIRGPQYSNMAQGIGSQYAKAGSNLLSQDTATADSLYEQIRNLQRPEEERQRGIRDQSAFGSGRLGMKLAQYGGTPEELAFQKALGESKNQAAYQAINQADQLAASQRQQAMALSGMGLSAEQQANMMRQMGYQDQMGLAGARMSATQAQNALQQQRFMDQMGITDKRFAAGQYQNALRDQAFQNQMALAGGNLSAQQAQAALGTGYGQMGLNAYASQLQQAAAARQAGMSELDQSIARGTGLFSSGFGVEQLGLTPLQLGAQFGGSAATAGGNVGSMLMSGANNAALIGYKGGENMADIYAGIGSSLGGLKWG